jgi:CRISPR-associated protein Cmr4
MNYRHALVFYQPVTPLHVGCGQDVGVVDLPVIRERTTGYPFVPGSGIRGCLRDLFERRDKDRGTTDTVTLFGPTAEQEDAVRHAGSAAVHDAKVLLFPVRADPGSFLWLTCPAVLARFARDLSVFLDAAEAAGWPGAPALAPAEETALTAAGEGRLFLEELAFDRIAEGGTGAAAARAALASWAAGVGQALAEPRLASSTVLVSDGAFLHFVSHATVVQQHNRLTSAKTVEGSALFSVEAVPPETVFYGFLGATDSRRPLAESAPPAENAPTAESAPPAEAAAPTAAPAGPRSAAEVMACLRSLWEGEAGGSGPAAGTLHLGGDEGTGMGVTRLVWTQGGASR